MARFVNLTPHPITVRKDCARCGGTTAVEIDGLPIPCDDCGQTGWVGVTYPPRMKDGKLDPARIGTITSPVGEIDGMPVVENRWGALEGLPAPEEGVVYIVSLIVVQYVDRAGYSAVGRYRGGSPIYDIVCPDTSPTGGAIRWRLGDVDPEGLDGAPIPSARVGQVRAVTRWVRPRA